MAFVQADLDSINAAIASGAMEVRYADGSGAKYRSLDEMLRVRDMISAVVAPVARPPGVNPSAALVSFTGRG